MNLIFFRHAIASDKKNSHNFMDDFRREITKEGRKETKLMVKTWKPLFKNLNAIFTSPLVRAVQTAEIISKYHPESKLELLESLDSTAAIESFLESIRHLKGSETYCFVGHEPHLTLCVSALLKETQPNIDLKKSGIILLTGESMDRLKLAQVLSPELTLKLRILLA